MSEVSLTSRRTNQSDATLAAAELFEGVDATKPKLAVVFANRDRDLPALVKNLRERLPKETRLVGATTGSAIDRTGFHNGETVLALLSGDLEVGIGLGKGLSEDALGAGARALQRASSELGRKESDLDPHRYVAMVMDDGFRCKKEELLLGVLDRNPTLTAVGGGASDNMMGPQPRAEVIVDGEIATESVAVVLFHTEAPWAALRPHAYLPSGERLKFTKVDDATKRVIEIDGKPAAAEYARILGVGTDELEFGKPRGFSLRPTALRVGREYFMRSPYMPLPDGTIKLISHVTEGTELELMKMGDMVVMTKKIFTDELPSRVKSPRAALLFNCSGRSWVAHSLGIQQAIGDTMKFAPPVVGLDVTGEIYNGFAIDTTLTVLAFGAD
jgi:hypothetical protein